MRYLLILYLIFISSISLANKTNKYFLEGEKLFIANNFKEAKILFEKDIVFDTKNVKSYLYLSKIHQNLKNQIEEEKNLKTVLLLDPKNEEGLFLLTKLYLNEGDFNLAEKEYNLLKKVCKSFCNKLENLELEILKFKK